MAVSISWTILWNIPAVKFTAERKCILLTAKLLVILNAADLCRLTQSLNEQQLSWTVITVRLKSTDFF